MSKTIGGLFGRSVFGPIHEHMTKVLDGARKLEEVFPVFLDGKDRLKVSAVVKEVSELEYQADLIKEGIRERLTKSVFSAVERSDILALLKDMDHVIDGCQDVAKLFEMRFTPVPGAIAPHFRAVTAKVTATCASLHRATEMLAASPENIPAETVEKVLRHLEQVHKDEFACDKLQGELGNTLFANEKSLDPVSVIFLMNINKTLGDVANSAENASDVLRRVILH
ncbi:MAG: DUF47 family protein [Planctomycetota bacterium]